MAMFGYFYEIYTKGPQGQDGWEIHVGHVVGAETRAQALDRVKDHFADKFDTVIQCHEWAGDHAECERTRRSCGGSPERYATLYAYPLTRLAATVASYGQEFYHVRQRNSDGSAARCRVTGRCVTWKRRPNDFRLPVKYGLRTSFYITPSNVGEWLMKDPTGWR